MSGWPGAVHRLGATREGEGTNFAPFTEHATAVELCLFAGRPGIRVGRAGAAPLVARPRMPLRCEESR